MKAPSSTLFDLVHRMSKEEKRFFSRYIFLEKTDAVNNLLYDLFKAIDNMKTYNETQLKQRFVNKLTVNSFKKFKSILKERILESIYFQGVHNSPLTEYRKKISYAEILAAKGLSKEANNFIESIKQVTTPESHVSDFIGRTEALASQLWIMRNTAGKNPNELVNIACCATSVAEKIHRSFNIFSCCASMITLLHNSLLLQTREERTLFQNASAHFDDTLSILNEQEPFCVKEARVAKAILNSDFDRAHELQLLIWIMYSHTFHNDDEKYSKDDMVCYGSILLTTITTSILSGKKDDLPAILVRAFFTSMCENISSHYFDPIILYGQLVYYNHLVDNEKTGEIANRIEKLEIWNDEKQNMALCRILGAWLSIIYKSQGNLSTALSWARKVINTNPKDTSYIHYREFCMLFSFVIEYDMETSNGKQAGKSFKRSVESVSEHIRKHAEIDRSYLGLFILTFKRIYEVDKEIKVQEVFERLKNDIVILNDAPVSLFFNSLFDFNMWISEKAEAKGSEKMVA